MYPYRNESVVDVNAPMPDVFALLDEHAKLSSHMSQSSWKMGGGKMTLEFDAGQGKTIGSRLRLAGRVFGILLSVDEEICEYQPPQRKVWETMGAPKLLVIGSYRMGFELTPLAARTRLRVFIDYDRPQGVVTRWLGWLFGAYYARWCTQQMAKEAVKRFAGI